MQRSPTQYTTLHYITLQHSTMQYTATQYTTLQCITLQHNTMQRSATEYTTYHTSQYNTIRTTQHITTQHKTIQEDTVRLSTIQCETTVSSICGIPHPPPSDNKSMSNIKKHILIHINAGAWTFADIDECSELSVLNTCSELEQCHNVPGSHYCTCNKGYTHRHGQCTGES